MKTGDPVEVRVKGIGAGGVGVGDLPDGRVVFLPRTAPGDRVLVRVREERARWARGESLALLAPGKDRREAPCPRYGECDGCALQHLDYSAQLLWKSRIVGDALRRLGGLVVEDPPVEASPQELTYRNRTTMTLRRLPGGRIVAGFRQLRDRRRVLDVGEECLLMASDLAGLWQGLRGHWGSEADRFPEGPELRLTIRWGDGEGGLVLRGGRGNGSPRELLEAVPALASVWRAEKGRGVRHLAGKQSLRISWLGETAHLSGGSFLQVNHDAGENLHRFVLSTLGSVEGTRIVEGYSGVGVLGWRLARMGARVLAVETDEGAVSDARSGAPSGFEAIRGRVEDVLPGLLPADLVILNPPRAGLDPRVPQVLEGNPPRWLVYVSCDPGTLARDLNRMSRRFALTGLRCFDLFPQTGHVETVAFLERFGE